MHLTDAGNLESALSASSCRAHTVMLHIHFGAGRLGLGLPAPFFQKPGSELFLLNRAQSGANPTGSTQLAPERRAQLLSAHSERKYGLQTPGELSGVRETVRYDGFRLYSPPDIEEVTGD